ncbi:MAG: periplasmic heavy metal sensor [Pseudomonadota bacterium]
MADPNVPQTPRRGLGRAGKVLLYVSLALNLAVAGLVVGAVALGSDRARDKRPPTVAESGLRPIMHALSGDDRRGIARQIRSELRRDGRSREEMRTLMQEFVDALGSEPYDPTRIEALLAAQRSEANIRLDSAGRALLERVNAMSAEERIGFSQRLAQELDKPRGPRPGQGGPRKDD